ncbi:MAG: hypothetical protein ACE5K1_11185 [Acidiferrobacterales bacterium]
MSLIVDKFSKRHRLVSHGKESEFQACLTAVASQMFGPSAVYVDVRTGLTAHDILSLPSAYVIDLAQPESPALYVIKVAIARQTPFWNTGVELFKLVAGFDDARGAIRDYLRDQVSQDTEASAKLEEARSRSAYGNVGAYLHATLQADFRGVVVIDEACEALNAVLGKINADLSVLELRTFEAEDGSRLYHIDTLYDDGAPRAGIDTLLVPMREDSLKRVFLGESQWRAVSIPPALKDKIRFIAAFQGPPVNAATHLAEVLQIRLSDRGGRYDLILRGSPREIKPIPLKVLERAPQGPVYTRRSDLLRAESLEVILP